jgi:spoIIIJ-associated protein
MSSGKIDFYGKEVTDAIKMACDTLQVPQEEIAIEVVETGSMGIFGLIRKKAHIRAAVKGTETESEINKPKSKAKGKEKSEAAKSAPVTSPEEDDVVVKEAVESEGAVAEAAEEPTGDKKDSAPEGEKKKGRQPRPAPVEISAESVELVRQHLEKLLEHMDFPSPVTAELENGTINLQVGDEHEEALTAQDGKIIDSLQYLLRKLAARQVEEKIRLSIDIGEFREKRKVELIERAKELCALVKEDGKTQAIPALNPSERRIVHVVLQEDNDIRSRSVGDGLFKKVLIYKPGKGKKPGGNKRGGRGRRGGKSSKKNQENDNS